MPLDRAHDRVFLSSTFLDYYRSEAVGLQMYIEKRV